MENNCLVTKLKSVVSDDSLPIIDTIRLYVDTTLASAVSQDKRRFRITPENTTGVPLKLTNVGGNFCDSDGSNPTPTMTISSGDVFVYYTATTAKILIEGKTNIRELITAWDNDSVNIITVDYKDLDYSSLYHLYLRSDNQRGNLRDFVHALSPRRTIYLEMPYTIVSGTLSDLAPMSNLAQLNITGCVNISGNVEDLAVNRQNGDTMILQVPIGTVKYQGETLSSVYTYTLTFDGAGGVTVTH